MCGATGDMEKFHASLVFLERLKYPTRASLNDGPVARRLRSSQQRQVLIAHHNPLRYVAMSTRFVARDYVILVKLYKTWNNMFPHLLVMPRERA